jgi:hypothetical protein
VFDPDIIGQPFEPDPQRVKGFMLGEQPRNRVDEDLDVVLVFREELMASSPLPQCDSALITVDRIVDCSLRH